MKNTRRPGRDRAERREFLRGAGLTGCSAAPAGRVTADSGEGGEGAGSTALTRRLVSPRERELAQLQMIVSAAGATLDMGSFDPGHARLYLAAAAHLARSGSPSVRAKPCAIGSSSVGPSSEVFFEQERLLAMRLKKLLVALAALSTLSFAIFSDALFAQRKVDPASAAQADIPSRNVADPHALEEQLKSVASKVTPCAVAVGGGRLGGSGVIVSADGLVLTQSHCALTQRSQSDSRSEPRKLRTLLGVTRCTIWAY